MTQHCPHRETCCADNVVIDGSKVGEFGKVGREQKSKSIVMDGVKGGKEDKVTNVVRPRETQSRKTRDVGRCGRGTKTRRHML